MLLLLRNTCSASLIYTSARNHPRSIPTLRGNVPVETETGTVNSAVGDPEFHFLLCPIKSKGSTILQGIRGSGEGPSLQDRSDGEEAQERYSGLLFHASIDGYRKHCSISVLARHHLRAIYYAHINDYSNSRKSLEIKSGITSGEG